MRVGPMPIHAADKRDELDGEDWMCPKCGKTFEHPGKCPTHDLQLVTFEEYASGKKTEATTLPPSLMFLVIAAIAGAVYYFSR